MKDRRLFQDIEVEGKTIKIYAKPYKSYSDL
jgi:hypothetical protein